MALPELASLSVEHKIEIPFAGSSEGDHEISRSMGEDAPPSPVLYLWIKACSSKRWDDLVDAATVKRDGKEFIEYQTQAEAIYAACVKGAAGTDGERVEFTADDAAALATDWPKHVRTTALNHIISLNSVGTLAPLGRRAKT